MKSERLKKLETELKDLQQWLELGLVPKQEIDKHHQEIVQLQERIEEEKHRLIALKESGDYDEYIAPKRTAAARAGYADTPTLSDIQFTEDGSGLTDTGLGFDTESSVETESTYSGLERTEFPEEGAEEEDEEDEDPFSDRNRWKRGIIDPDEDHW